MAKPLCLSCSFSGRLVSGFPSLTASHAALSLSLGIQMVPYMAASKSGKSYGGLELVTAALESLASINMTDGKSHMIAESNKTYVE